MNHCFSLIAFALSGALICGCRQGGQADAPKPMLPAPAFVQTAQPRRGEISRWVVLPGSVRPLQQATLHAKVSGYLKSIAVDAGDHVGPGAVLAEIESPELLADAAKYKAELNVAELNLKRLVEARQKAPDLVVPLTVDEARSKLEVAQANFNRNETLLNFSRITAPFQGVVTRRFVDPGALIPAGTSGGASQAAILTVMDFSSVRISVPVPENEVPLIRTGLLARITVSELPGRVFTGTVTRFAYALEEGSRTMLAEVQLPNPQAELRPGMYVTARVALQTKADALLIPAEALVTEKTKTSVFKVVAKKVVKTPIKAGFQDGAAVEVLEGVAAGETVAIAGKQTLSDGQAVEIVEGK